MQGLAMRFLGHSTVRLELGGRVVLTDPVLTPRIGPLRRVAPMPSPADHADVDIALVSHLHADHLHVASLRMLPARTRVVVPRGAGRWLRSKGISRVLELDVGETFVDGTLRIRGVEARHSGYRWGPRSSRGPQCRAMGHLVESLDARVYVAGDTDLFDGMASLPRPDVALLPVWGWGPEIGPGHLDPARAAQAVTMLRPRVAVPVHWGTLAPGPLVRAPGPLGRRMRDRLVERPIEFAEAVASNTAAGLPDCHWRPHVALTHPGRPVVLPTSPARR